MCSVAHRESEAREKSNIHSFKTVDGRVLDIGVPKMRASTTYVYEYFHYPKLSAVSRCSELIDQLLGIIASRPPYLSELDGKVHAAMLLEFRDSSVTGWMRRDWGGALIADLPIERLDVLLRHWVEDRLADKHPLKSSYALNTARFAEAHAWGETFHRYESENWRIESLVAEKKERYGRGLDDPKLKKDITSNLGGHIVELNIPEACSLVGVRNSHSVIAGPSQVYFVIERCHLSSGIYDHDDLRLSATSPAKHSMADEFCFRGKLCPTDFVRKLEARQMVNRDDEHRWLKCEVPGSWINRALARDLEWFGVPGLG